MKAWGMALFQRVSELIACGLAAALLIAVTWRADQGLDPQYRIETFEVQYATLWPVDPSDPNDALAWLVVYLLQVSAALARAC
jgi:hypothetical protein